jgi:hypothetical protein
MLRSAISAFTRVFDAPSARSRACSTRHQRVRARLRRAISAFARVFDALCLAAWCAADTGGICSRLCGAA